MLNKSSDHIFCVCSFFLKWETAASGCLGEVSVCTLWSALSCASCAHPSSSRCCWHWFKPQFQPQDVAEITENPSQFPRIWWKRGAVGWVGGRDTLTSDTGTVVHRDSGCVWGAPAQGRCMWGFICLWLSSRLMQKHAWKQRELWLCYCKMQCWCIL